MIWSPVLDTFTFKLKNWRESPSTKVTKRKVLSDTSKLFDPLGWVFPILSPFKIFLQDLWIEGLEWDKPLNEQLFSTWKSIRNQLDGLNNIRIPRWLGCNSETSWSLHGLSDASKRAYSACIYYVPESGPTMLICAKSRVAPVNTISIPKLELSGALLLSRLIDYILPTFTCKPCKVHCWNGSRNMLCLLRSSSAKLKPFKANRVSEIITTLPNARWRYVLFAENSADCATRGMSAKELETFPLWWSGPSWLQDESRWPQQLVLSTIETNNITAFPASEEDTTHWVDKFHSFNRLVRVTAQALRWLQKPGTNGKPTPLSAMEIQAARIKVIKYEQYRHFHIEIDLLKQNKPNSPTYQAEFT